MPQKPYTYIRNKGGQFVKCVRPRNKGLTLEQEFGKEKAKKIKGKSSKSHKGQHSSPKTEFKKGCIKSIEHRRKNSEAHKGAKSYLWKGGITLVNKRIRNTLDYRLWLEAVFARDNWTCQSCGGGSGKLNAHHILSFANFPHKRFDITNGITLCKECHKKTDTYLKKELTNAA